MINLPDSADAKTQIDAINQYSSTLTNNATNTYQGSSETIQRLMNGKVEPGKRDSQADIQYFSVNQGVNRKTLIQPIIAPRITDQDHWGSNSTVRSDINKQTYRDITDADLDLNEMNNVNGTRRSAGIPQNYLHRTFGADVEMNSVHDPNPYGNYPGGQADQYLQDRRDFNAQILPLYKNKNNFPIKPINYKEMECKIPGLNRNLTVQQEMDPNEVGCYYDTEMVPTQDNPNEVETKGNREAFMKRMYQNVYTHQEQQKPMGTEGFAYRQPQNQARQQPLPQQQMRPHPQQQHQMRPQYGGHPQPQAQDFQQHDVYPHNTQPTSSGFSQFMPEGALQNYFRNRGAQIVAPDTYYNTTNRVPPGVDVQTTPVTDQLLEPTPAYVLTDKYFEQPQARLFLQDIQPKLYSYAVDEKPINSNIGITYAPQNPPKVLSQLADSSIYSAYPLISRVDPQLVRRDGTNGQIAQNPVRTNWTDEYSNFQPPIGSINFEDIYDPRFTSYGDPYRSYSDINLGQVQYYYSDVDAYRRPNFITRSQIDMVEFTTPNGQIKPYYNQTASLDDVRAQVENERSADELFHRQDLMSSQMSKRNAELWQLKSAPVSRAAHSNMSFGPT